MTPHTLNLQSVLEAAAHEMKAPVQCTYALPPDWNQRAVHTSYQITLGWTAIYLGCNSAGVLETWGYENYTPRIQCLVNGVRHVIEEIDPEPKWAVIADLLRNFQKLARKNVIVIPPDGLLPSRHPMDAPKGVTIGSA